MTSDEVSTTSGAESEANDLPLETTGERDRRMPRRAMLGLAGAAAGAAALTTLNASPAAAANADPLVLGKNNNSATLATGLGVGGSALYGFGVTDVALGSITEKPALFGHAKNSTFDTAVAAYHLSGTKGQAILATSEQADAIVATAKSGVAVRATAYGTSAVGVLAITTSPGSNAVEALSESSGGFAVYAAASQGSAATFISSVGVAVYITSNGTGEALIVANTDDSNSSPAVYANTAGSGPALSAFSSNGPGLFVGHTTAGGVGALINVSFAEGIVVNEAGNFNAAFLNLTNANAAKPALRARTAGTGPGVQGESVNGRGGLFTGKVAEVRLLPSTAATHPASGLAGDLFVDASARLWFCKGGTTWKQLA